MAKYAGPSLALRRLIAKSMPRPHATYRQPGQEAANTVALLERARACFERHEWNDAYEALMQIDRSPLLKADDLYRLSWSAGLTGRDEAMFVALERLYNALLADCQLLPAARAAFWFGFRLLALGQAGRAGGWLRRSQRLVERAGDDCVEQVYLLLPTSLKHLQSGALRDAHDAAARAAAVGERFAEADLTAFARHLQARALLAEGALERALPLLDEAMVLVDSGELSPVVTGILYCSAIASCQRVYAYDRAREWTTALNRWCEAHPQLGMFTGHCRVHRAEVLELGGSWPEAVEELHRALAVCVRDTEREAAGSAHYRRAEIHRLRGEFEAAEAAYRNASRCGIEPQPGMALLRLVQGERDAAANATRRVVLATGDPLQRTRYLPAHVEVMLAVGDVDEARSAAVELEQTAARLGTDVLGAIAAHARAEICLAEGQAQAAVTPLRRAFGVWQQLGAPYLAARLRMPLARACAMLGDVEGAQLELEAARETFEALGAAPDLAALRALRASFERVPKVRGRRFGLTERELQVLRLVAAGKTNKEIARELALAEKTVDRHLSNIFAKVDVSTRAAATAFAYRHALL
jgi:ATP/maltotriose-dependent transcriptional regulator MalT